MLLRLPPRLCEINREALFGSGVRRVRSNFQARIWLGDGAGGHVNLGLYGSASAARSVVRDVIRSAPDGAWTPLDIWRTAVSRAYSFAGDIAETLRALLPKWVYPGFGGKGLMFKVRDGGEIRFKPGFTDPEQAHRGALVVWEEIHGKLRPPVWMPDKLKKRLGRG